MGNNYRVWCRGISLGNVLLKTGAAQWLSDQTFGVLGLKHLPIIATIALITLLIY